MVYEFFNLIPIRSFEKKMQVRYLPWTSLRAFQTRKTSGKLSASVKSLSLFAQSCTEALKWRTFIRNLINIVNDIRRKTADCQNGSTPIGEIGICVSELCATKVHRTDTFRNDNFVVPSQYILCNIIYK